MTASEEVRDAHHRALRWSHVLSWQVDRLYAARANAMVSQQEVRQKARYSLPNAWPFHKMDAEAHFVLVAARQLLRALRAFDGNDRLPAGMDEAQLRLVRDALEHWDESNGKAARNMSELRADPKSHKWTGEGPGVLGDLVSDAALQAWGESVYTELTLWNPW